MATFKTKKSLGQHFLRSKTALQKIVESANISAEETVLEIGPGMGALTEGLLGSGARVIAVEADARCTEELQKKFATHVQEGNLLLVHGDIREKTVQEKIFAKDLLGGEPYKLVANIPYYITGMLFRLFLETLRQPSELIFLIQKEVAEEVIAKNGKEGVLSLSIKAFGDPRIVATVKREAFSPPPKVDSAILKVSRISRERLHGITTEDYFRVVKAGLSSRRKMLRGNLVRELHLVPADLESLFEKHRLQKNIRGEDLPFKGWVALARELGEKKW